MGEPVAACPKCGTPRDEARTHCKSCGLAHAKMDAFEKARDEVPDVLNLTWQNTVENWDEPARHDALLRLVTQHDAYAWAAARYRERKDDSIAKQQLERVRKAAEVTLMASAAERKASGPEPYRNTMVMLVLLVILIVAGLVYAFARGSSTGVQRERFDNPPPPAATK